MKTHLTRWIACTGLALVTITFLAWKRTDNIPTPGPYGQNSDTTPSRKKIYSDERGERNYRIGDLDMALEQLNRIMKEIDFEKLVDKERINSEIKTAMSELKKVDMEKINREIKSAMAEINWDKTHAEMERAMKEANVRLKDIDLAQIQREVSESLNAAKIGAKLDMEGIQRSVEQGLAGAREGIEKAKQQLHQMKEFTETLEKDGLINKKKGYRIEVKDDWLYINGTRQTKEVNDKYSKYFWDHNYSIRSDGEEITTI